MKEKDFLNSIFPLLKQGEDIIVGPGDDCAVIDIGDSQNYFLLAVDQLISNVHYDHETTEPEKAGAKLLKRNISDIASMGGTPSHALITLAMGDQDNDWLLRFYEGLTQEANKWGISICGGDIAKIPGQSFFISTLSITGKVNKNKLCLRKNLCIGESIYITGSLGDSYNTEHHLNFIPNVKEAEFLAGRYSNAMMDISDGLLLDLQRMAEASNLTIKISLNDLPARSNNLTLDNLLTDGEDYGLIFSVKPSFEKELLEKWPFKEVKISKIGQVIPLGDYPVIDEEKTIINLYSKSGWDHFEK